MDAKGYLKEKKELVDKELEKLIPNSAEGPHVIHKAMRYMLKGGKRIRPILCMASCQACGGELKKALKTACAIEMIHTYSLVHDDLPSMDNDDFRRGRLSCHRKYGIANAILTGDALLTLSFNILADATPKPALNARIIRELSSASGTYGMIGGQAVDIDSNEKDIFTLEYINIHKTGALITASCKAGAIAAEAKEKDIDNLSKFGEYIGFVFQIVDDILDGEGIVKVLGPKRAYERASELIDKAKESISYLGRRTESLTHLADFILTRKY